MSFVPTKITTETARILYLQLKKKKSMLKKKVVPVVIFVATKDI